MPVNEMGVTYKLNKKVEKQMRRMGKIPESEAPAPAVEVLADAVQTADALAPVEAPADQEMQITVRVTNACKLVYGVLLVKGRMNYSELSKACGHSSPGWGIEYVERLKAMGLVNTEKMGSAKKSPVECYVLADAPLPEGWDVDEMIAMAGSVRPAERKEDAPKEPKPFGAHVVKAFSTDAVVLEKAKPVYEAFYEDLRNLPEYSVPEIRGIVKDLMELCRKRIAEVHYECPVCRGRLKRTGSEVRCEGKCKISVGAPDLDTALKYMRLIAEAKKKEDD